MMKGKALGADTLADASPEPSRPVTKPPLLVILGPTATGKTALSLALAEQIGERLEIISADSAMVYRHLDIGTAKPSREEQQGIPHHLIDIIDPDEKFSVADFQSAAAKAAEEIHARGRLPVVVGGTGFYIRSLVDSFEFPPMEPDWNLRRRLEAEAEAEGRPVLHRKLKEVDPVSARRLHPNDMHRVIRALEVYTLTGRPLSSYGGVSSPEPDPGTSPGEGPGKDAGERPFRDLKLGLTTDRDLLYERINHRVDEQIKRGFVGETQRVLDMGYAPDCPGLQVLGYRQITAHLQGELDLDEAVRIIKRDTRHFARRQFTWFRREPRVHWLKMGPDGLTEDIITEALVLIKENLRTP